MADFCVSGVIRGGGPHFRDPGTGTLTAVQEGVVLLVQLEEVHVGLPTLGQLDYSLPAPGLENIKS